MKQIQPRFQTVHQLDSIYYGKVNNSYQKDGFGILQTLDFDTYLGYWRNNKTEGLGLVVLANGTIIYANFNRDVIDGLAIIDDGDLLVCGIYRNRMIVGVGFEYNHGLKVWKMNRYHKGIAIQLIKQQFHDISTGLPKIINVEQSIYFHLYSYIYRNYFPDLEYNITTEISAGLFFYGICGKDFQGPGICVSEYFVTQAGFYQEGVLHGFGFKAGKNPVRYEFGCYHKGRRDGPFLDREDQKVFYNQYRKGILMKNLSNSQALILKNQKNYNFNCKDFFSAKSNVPFQQFNKGYRTLDLKQYQQKKQNFLSRTKPTTSPQKSPKRLSPLKDTNSKTGKEQRNYLIIQQKQKSSVQIMREKMGQFYGIVSGRRRSYESSPKKTVAKVHQPHSEEFDDEIAKQESPFY